MHGFPKFAVVLAGLLLVGPAARSQSSPSADDIIKALKPTPQSLTGSTRGIRPLNNTAPPAPSSATAPVSTVAPVSHAPTAAAAPVQRAANRPAIDLNVEFETGSADLTPAAEGTLTQLGKALSSPDLAGYRFRIVGHTDTVGSAPMNLSLSQHRAATVADYIEQHFGVSSNRLEPVGVGEQDLLVPTPPQTPNARNRRVEVINIGG